MTQKNSIANVIYDPVIKAEIITWHFEAILVAVFLLVMASAIYPAWVASRTKPLEAIRTE